MLPADLKNLKIGARVVSYLSSLKVAQDVLMELHSNIVLTGGRCMNQKTYDSLVNALTNVENPLRIYDDTPPVITPKYNKVEVN